MAGHAPTLESMSSPDAQLGDRYDAVAGRVLLSGVQALVRLPVDQRRADAAARLRTAGFVTGYPGSPLAGYDLELSRHRDLLEEWGVVHQPGLNEELAATAIAGSQLAMLQPDRTVDGVSSYWYGKSPGLDRAGDAIRHGNLMGTGPTGGVLVLVGDDPQAKSSSVPSTSEPSLFALGLPILSPADPQDLLDLGLHGVALSRASGLWVGVRIPASVADASQSVVVDAERLTRRAPEREIDGVAFTHRVTAQLLGATLIELERSLYGARLEMARRYAALNELDRVTQRGPHDVVGVVAAGPAYLAVEHALRRVGLDERTLADAGVRLLKIAVPHPLNEALVREFARDLREVVVVEDKRGFLENLVKAALYGTANAPRVVGKHDEAGRDLIPPTGEVDPDALADVLAQRILAQRENAALRAWRERQRPPAGRPLPLVRGAYFCAGCPHSTAVRVPDGARVGSGSGCHGLAIQMDPRQVGTVVGRFQMGGEGAMWNGMSHFIDAEHFFQNLGDGTFAHSGSLALRASVASGVNITYKLLVNSAVAMTGGQPITGGRGLGDLTRLLLAEGVRRIIVTTVNPHDSRYAGLPDSVAVWERRRLIEAQRLLAVTPGVTVLIHDQECATEARRRRRRAGAEVRRHVVINPLVCDGCGECGALSNCLAVRPVDTPWGRRTEIHQESCTLDGTCLDAACPALLTVIAEPGHRRAPVRAVDPTRLVEPPSRRVPRDFSVRVTGVGGTGVVTVAQVLAWAAHLEGRAVRTMDQTGIAQKGGAVVSDLRVSDEAVTAPHRLGAGECDLYLGGELLVAADPKNLLAADPHRTLAVVSTSRVPTGRQVADPTIAYPDLDEIRARVDAVTRRDESRWLNAADLSRRLLGSDTFANVVLLGVAYQIGALALRATSIERALEVNGVAVNENVTAFRLGRLVVTDPGAPELTDDAGPAHGATSATDARARGEIVALVGAPVGSELEGLVSARVADLARYQDLAYARRYAGVVARVRRGEVRVRDDDDPLARTVAIQLHRLMAYKDEYEVAALLTDPAQRARLRDDYGSRVRVAYHLRPPLVRRLGRSRPLTIGSWSDSTLRALVHLRRLRGTALDPFGHDHVRQLERRVRDDYATQMIRLADELTAETYERALALAELADLLRGFDDVKTARHATYDRRRRELLASP